MKQYMKILPIADPDFNYGHGKQFFRAVEKMIRETTRFNAQQVESNVTCGITPAGQCQSNYSIHNPHFRFALAYKGSEVFPNESPQ